jgi:hypothetical protein
MGEHKDTSITDIDGKFHHLSNVYVVGPAVFPTIGDANPSLTGLTLARRTADAILGTRRYTWVKATDGVIPDGAASHGRDVNGEPLFVARAHLKDGGLQLGKIGAGLRAAHIPFGGREEKVNPYEVLMEPGVWVSASGGHVPDGAIAAGFEADGEPLFVARAQLSERGTHLGKVRKAFGGAIVGFANQEIQVEIYDVLVGYTGRPVA